MICVFNDQSKLDNCLVRSLRMQEARFELLVADNRYGKITCGAKTLNEMALNAKYDYFMFVHQDVTLGSAAWLGNVQGDFKHLKQFGAAGVAGKSEAGLSASVFHGTPPQFVGPQHLTEAVPVQTLDGCLMIVPKEIFLKNGFDEKTCKGWYLYVVDYCLDLARRGLKVYVLPHEVYHESRGPSDPTVYEETKQNIIRKHRCHTSMVYTTMGNWKTGRKLSRFRRLLKNLRIRRT